jgi:PAS domain S-box-containing protein
MSDPDEEKVRQEQQLKVHGQIAFASGLFQGDVTIRTLLESIAEGVIIIDVSGTILLANLRAEKMFGYARTNLIGKPLADLLPERFRKVHAEHVERYFAAPRIRPMDQRPDNPLQLIGLHQDGTEFPVEISLSFLETINGVLALAFVNDITLRKQYESDLHKIEELFHLQIESVKNYAIFTLDCQGNVLNWNAGAERLQGYAAEEIIGRHSCCFYSDADRKAGIPEAELKQAAAEGQFAGECWRVRKDASVFWADVVITALRDETGNLYAFSEVTHDITGRKKTEDALRFSEARYRTLFRDNPSMIATLDAEWTILSANPIFASHLGYSQEELVGHSLLELFLEEDRAAVVEQFQRCLENPDQVGHWRLRKVRNGGGVLWVEETAQAVYDLNGAPNLLLVCLDVTERKQAEDEIGRLNESLAERAGELEAANMELEAFNYTVAHDLRQPLSILNNYCQVIDRLFGDQLPEDCKDYIREAYEKTLQMNRLIEALLNFSRLSHVEPRRSTVNLSLLALEVAKTREMTAPGRQIDFKIADGVIANGEANLLRAVLDNLLGNACKFTEMREKAVIEFGVRDIDGVPAYFVRDNGSGFDMAHAGKLFTPFQRLPGAEKQRGFGIGLATAERIIRRHGGRIWAEGEPGKGACFYFTLPYEEIRSSP